MTNEEINIKIAEACGWTNCISPLQDEYHFLTSAELGLAMGRPVGRNFAIHSDGLHHKLPDYCNDLNAMHEAEKTLKCTEQYETELIRICKEVPIWHATSRQRAEAFLRTLNLWTE